MKWLALAVALAVSSPAAAAVNQRLVRDMETQISLTAQAERGDAAIKAMLGVACLELIRIGRRDLCDDIQGDYNERFDGYLERMVTEEDLGDHKPLNLWLAVVTDLLQLTLGPQVMEWTHLDDLRIMNYAIPVVFNPRADNDWCLETSGVACIEEYGLHFVPFSGTCAYWGAYISCAVATYGAGTMFLCSPIGMGTEYVVRRWVAPKLGDRIYIRVNG
jgi:hypothetical protein